MFRVIRVIVGIGFLCLCAMSSFAQSSSLGQPPQPCDNSCQKEKVDALFKAMDDKAASDRPKPSQSKECAVFNGREGANTLIDVCAKLKYVRTIAVGTDTNFSCPPGDDQLPFELIALCAAVSENGSVAYVEAEFFGGDGTQAAAIFKNGKELGPTVVATEAINGALAAIGVQRLNHKDEFDALELGRHRDTEKWLI